MLREENIIKGKVAYVVKDKKEVFRALKFLMFSISAGAIELISFTLLDLIPNLDYVIKAYISLTLSVLWNFTLNRKFTFQSANNVHLADIYLVQTLGWNEILVKFVTMLVNFVTEFIFQRLVVYGKSVDTNARAKAKEKANTEENGEKE